MSGCVYIIIVEDSDTTVLVSATHSPVTSGKLVNWSTCRELEFPKLTQLTVQ